MSLTAKPSKGSPPIPGGTYLAICYSVVDLGTQYNEYYHKSAPKVAITWEIPSLRIEYEKDGEKLESPRMITKTYTNVLHEKSNLWQDLISWRGKPFTIEEAKGFDVSKILGANCILTVINVEKNGKVFANVAGVSKLMVGMEKKEPENELVQYDISSGVDAIPENVPNWLKDTIKKCEELASPTGGEPNPDWIGEDAPPPTDDDIPF
ncbi:hypothetical protein LCGC14_1970420 [marine sediment metagenome]|uniref:Uncharacterized protein n=1 Tax=marine sediment metagenome TaxID=412755 RepID=A0A0F9FC04_9ZZZZ